MQCILVEKHDLFGEELAMQSQEQYDFSQLLCLTRPHAFFPRCLYPISMHLSRRDVYRVQWRVSPLIAIRTGIAKPSTDGHTSETSMKSQILMRKLK